jgi:DNA-binding ferritin-like protein
VVQANSVPLALIGIGIAWLVAANTGLAERVVNNERVQAARRRIGEFADDIGIGGGSSGPSGGQILGPDGEPLNRTDSGSGNGWVHQAAGAARGAISSVRDAGNAVLDRAGAASDLANRASDQVTEKLSTDPWLIGVAGLVAGALFAAMLPPTKIERDYIEEARDELLNRANELGHEAAERVRELADTSTRTEAR